MTLRLPRTRLRRALPFLAAALLVAGALWAWRPVRQDVWLVTHGESLSYPDLQGITRVTGLSFPPSARVLRSRLETAWDGAYLLAKIRLDRAELEQFTSGLPWFMQDGREAVGMYWSDAPRWWDRDRAAISSVFVSRPTAGAEAQARGDTSYVGGAVDVAVRLDRPVQAILYISRWG